MNRSLFITYLLTLTVLMLTPGPDMLFCLASGLPSSAVRGHTGVGIGGLTWANAGRCWEGRVPTPARALLGCSVGVEGGDPGRRFDG
jgi:hypothetical protein